MRAKPGTYVTLEALMPVASRKAARSSSRREARKVSGFPPGSLEAKLGALGRKVPLREWNRLPPASSVNIDSVVCGKARLR